MALYCFLIRVYYYDDETYERVKFVLRQNNNVSLGELHAMYYDCFQSGFCSTQPSRKMRPTINLHVFYHMQKSRERNGPLINTSAEPFEALYAVLRRSCYKPGTPNTSKQILENVYLRER